MTTRDLYHLQRFSQQHRAVLLAKSAGPGRGFRYLCRNNISWWITLTGTYRTTALEFSSRPSRLMRLTAFTLIPFVCACHCYILSLHAQPSKLSALTKCSAENSTLRNHSTPHIIIRKQPNLIHRNSSHDQRRIRIHPSLHDHTSFIPHPDPRISIVEFQPFTAPSVFS